MNVKNIIGADRYSKILNDSVDRKFNYLSLAQCMAHNNKYYLISYNIV